MRSTPRAFVLCLALSLHIALHLQSASLAQGFVDVSGSTGVSLPITNYQPLGSGVCWGDFDRDGDQDLIASTGFCPTALNALRYYQNTGNGTFTDITSVTGLSNNYATRAIMAGDVDNDGDLDVFIANSWTSDELWINQGNAFFVEEGIPRGVNSNLGSFTASFGDYDNDGSLDLYVGTWQASVGTPEPNILYHNDGSGYFTDVTVAAGVGNMGLTFTGVFHDYDDDGWLDIFVGNDKGYYSSQPPNATYRNNGNGTFTEVSGAIGTLVGMGAMGSDFADVFNDGGWDIFVSNVQTGHVFHRWNPQTGAYVDVAAAVGAIAYVEGWAVQWMDYDNDGFQDLHITHAAADNHLYRNTGWPGPWINVAPAVGAATSGTKRVSTVVDFDNDGRLDLFLPRSSGSASTTSVFLRNTVSGGNWLRVQTVGTVSNRDGIGAKLTAYVGSQTLRRQVKSGTGYVGCNDLRIHFGIGSATVIDRLVIRWPSGQVQEFWNVPANQELVAQEPMLSIDSLATPGSITNLRHTSGNDANLFSVLYLSLDTTPGLPLGDTRVVPGNLDFLGNLTFLTPGNPIMPTPMGFLDATGIRVTPIYIPWAPSLAGTTIYATGATVDGTIPPPWAPVRNILQALQIQIQ